MSMSQEEKDQLAKLSGFDRGNRKSYPFITYDARKKDSLKKLNIKDVPGGEAEFIEAPIEYPAKIVILKQRRKLGSWSKNDGTVTKTYTPEHNHGKEIVPLYEQVGNGKPSKVLEGNAQQMREYSDKLRAKWTLYVLHDGEVRKLKIQGKTLKNYMDWLKNLGSVKPFEKEVVLTSELEMTDNGMETYPITFNSGEDTDFSAIAPFIKEVAEACNESDLARTEAKPKADNSIPVVDVDDDVKEVNLDDIPY